MMDEKSKKRSFGFVPWLVVIWGVYAFLSIVAPIDQEGSLRYHLSATDNYIIRVTFQIPLLALWTMLFYGAYRFNRYTTTIGSAPEAAGFRSIVYGLSALIASLIITSYVGILNSYYPHDDVVREFVTLTNQYVGLVCSFASFAFFVRAGKSLVALVSVPFSQARAWLISMGTVAVFGAFYVYDVFNNPDRLVPTTPGVMYPAYYLPSDLWIVIGVIIPYLLVWVTGILSVLYIRHFTKFVSGTVYKLAFRAVGRGIVSLVLVSMGLQLLAQSGQFFVGVGLTSLLVIIYALLIAIGVGYLFIAQGARRLSLLETV